MIITRYSKLDSLIRKETLKQEKWRFERSFKNLTLPQQFISLLRLLSITGPRCDVSGSTEKKYHVGNLVNVIGQLMTQSTKTRIHKTTRNKLLMI